MMIKKFLILIVTTLSLTSCGYGPIYSDKNTMDFEITSFKIEGDTEVNSIVQNKLGKYLDNNSEKKYIVSGLKDGQIDAVVGTHQLLNKKLVYKDLGLLVIDEEQRFGVNQKEK